MGVTLRLSFIVVLVVTAGVVLASNSNTGADPAIDAEEQDFLHRINDYRAQTSAMDGIAREPLTLHTDLSEASDWFSVDMANQNYFPPNHISKDGRNPGQRSADFGYTGGIWGENIAAGNDTAAETFVQWKNSPPHNTNMLSPNYNLIGVGRAFTETSTYDWYWTTNFGHADGPVQPPVTPTPPPGETPQPTAPPTPGPTPEPPREPAIVPMLGCLDNSLAANDDGSSPQFNTSFPLNFFGQTYNSLYVNNNGNITFDGSSGAYVPFGLYGAAQKIVAAFFADIDTRGSGSGLVTYGNGVYTGNRTFCANWNNVGYFSSGADKLNRFQIMLVERADQGAGDFDIMMNFDAVKWEAGSTNNGTNGVCAGNPSCAPARMGYSNGTQQNSYEYPGSGVPGAFLDSNNTSGLIHNSENSLIDGRYVYFVRNGAPATGGTISGKVFARDLAHPMAGAPVQICGAPGCYTAETNDLGEFIIRGLEPADYNFRIFPGNDDALIPREFGPFTMTQNGSIMGLEFVLQNALVPPPDTSISARGTSGQIPMVYWGDELTLSTGGCAGGTASYQILQNGSVLKSGPMTEDPAGRYTAKVPPLAPAHGQGNVHIEIACPGGPPQVKDFNIYIDPSGHVRTVEGAPIAGAKVTLYRSDTENGEYTVVPDGSTIMSPTNRKNPDSTNASGHFGWDVIAGYYKVRAEYPGCTNPDIPGQDYTETEALEIPPPVFDLDIRLDCPSEALPPPQGDIDCSDGVTTFDVLQIFYFAAGFSVTQLGECPQLGGGPVSAVGDFVVFRGDVDCDEDIDAMDGLTMLRAIAGNAVTDLPAGCHIVGQ